MKKFLRFSLVCALAMVCGSMFADDVVWSESWDGWEAKVNPATDTKNSNNNYTFEGTVLNDDGSFKSGTSIYDEKLAGGEKPELLIAKNGGSFTAKIDMKGVSGNLTLQFKCNKNLTVTAEGATLGDVTASGNDYSYPVTVASGTSTISITFKTATNANARFDNAKLFSGEAKKPAGLSWGTASRTVTIGAENTFPTLTNGNNLSVAYSSSDESVATINSNGEITLKAAGKTTITAKFEGNSEYEAAEVSYELTVKEGSDTPAPQGGTEISVATALEKISDLGTTKTAYVDNKAEFEVKGYIVAISEMSPKPDGYGNATFTIADEKGGSTVITVFRCKDLENQNFTDADKIKVGDLVVVKGVLQIYVKGSDATPEISSCYLVSINDNTTGIGHATAERTNDAPAYNVAGQKVNASYKGIVIKNGKKVLTK